MAKEFAKRVHRTIKTKQIPRAAVSDVHRGVDDKLDPYVLAGVGQNAEEVWFHLIDEEWIIALRFLSYFSKTVELEKYDYVLSFLNGALIPHDHRGNVFLSKTEMLQLRNMV